MYAFAKCFSTSVCVCMYIYIERERERETERERKRGSKGEKLGQGMRKQNGRRRNI